VRRLHEGRDRLEDEAAGYEVFAINPMSVARYRERHSTSGSNSDRADAHLLAEIVRLDRAHHRPVVGASGQAEAVKVAARTHQSRCADRQEPAPTTWHSAAAAPGTRPPSASSPTGSSASSTAA
jgi:Transposase